MSRLEHVLQLLLLGLLAMYGSSTRFSQPAVVAQRQMMKRGKVGTEVEVTACSDCELTNRSAQVLYLFVQLLQA